MFRLDGEPTFESRVIKTLLRQFLKPYGDRITCVVYRKDPLDNYLFTTALLGVRQPEPMFGPLVWDDRRRDRPVAQENPLGFRFREGLTRGCHEKFEHEHWEAHLSGRGDEQEFQGCVERVRTELEPCLEDLLGNPDRKPLFPDLWYKERLARDRMRDEFRNLSPGMNLEDIASSLTRSLKHMADDLLPGNQTHIGLYFSTTKDWFLLGSNPIPKRLPRLVGGCCDVADDERNAFNWVDRSTRPVLLGRNLSAVWQRRLDNCDRELAEASREDDFAGICIVPLLDLNQPSRSMGVALLISTGSKRVAPAHLFLMSRVGLAAAGYLTPFLPIPGYPRWPNVSVSRGGATVAWSRAVEPDLTTAQRVAETFAKELMPIGSDVRIEPLEAGQSGAAVFRLDVKDKSKIQEVPRVLKIHQEEQIVEELRHYYEFVHNKSVGGTSRIDIARIRSLDDRGWGAIVYILVGAGEEAQPWSRWAKSASHVQIEHGLQQLYDQLLCWYDTTERVAKNPIDLLVTTPFLEGDKWSPTLQMAENPSWPEVRCSLEELSDRHRLRGRNTRTCVIHGDLHAGNIFSLIGKPLQRNSAREQRDSGSLSAVAVIDWGSVARDRHPLSDIAKLMADLHYKVRWKVGDRNAERKWAFGIIKDWGERMGFRELSWIPSLLHQLTKMLFYISPGDPQKPYFSDDARIQAWEDMKELMSMLQSPESSQHRPTQRRPTRKRHKP